MVASKLFISGISHYHGGLTLMHHAISSLNRLQC